VSVFNKVPFYSFGQALSGATDKYIQEKERSLNRERQEGLDQFQMDIAVEKMLRDQERYDLDKPLKEQALDLKRQGLDISRDKLKLERDKLKGSSFLPFEGKSSWAQTGNVLFKELTNQGLSPMEAQKRAIDQMREANTRFARVLTESGDTVLQEVPGSPLFKKRRVGGDGVKQSTSAPKRNRYAVPETTVSEAVQEATGYQAVPGTIRNYLSGLTGGLISPSEQKIQAESAIKNAENFFESLAQTDRVGVQELENVRKRFSSLKPGLFKTPEMAKIELKGLDDYLTNKILNLQQQLQSGVLNTNARKEANKNMAGLNTMRAYFFGTQPEEKFNPSSRTTPTNVEKAAKRQVDDILKQYLNID